MGRLVWFFERIRAVIGAPTKPPSPRTCERSGVIYSKQITQLLSMNERGHSYGMWTIAPVQRRIPSTWRQRPLESSQVSMYGPTHAKEGYKLAHKRPRVPRVAPPWGFDREWDGPLFRASMCQGRCPSRLHQRSEQVNAPLPDIH